MMRWCRKCFGTFRLSKVDVYGSFYEWTDTESDRGDVDGSTKNTYGPSRKVNVNKILWFLTGSKDTV